MRDSSKCWCLLALLLGGMGEAGRGGGGTDEKVVCEDGVEGVAIAGFLVGYCPDLVFVGAYNAWNSEIVDGFVDLVEGVNKSPSF